MGARTKAEERAGGASYAVEHETRLVSGRTLSLILAIIFAAGALLRLIPIQSSLPYASYVDEGHVLEPVTDLLRNRTWDPKWYGYPSLPFYLVAGAAVVGSPAYEWKTGRSLWEDVPTEAEITGRLGRYYDLIAPSYVFRVGRGLVFAFSLATMFLLAILAHRVAGDRVAVIASAFAAACPSLVIRSNIVIVDTIAAFWALGTLVVAERLLTKPVGSDGVARLAVGAGILSGLAFSTKYQVGAVFAAVLFVLATRREALGRRLRRILASGSALVLTALACMPAWYLKPAAVLKNLRDQLSFYAHFRQDATYLDSAWIELGPPFVFLAAVGIVLLAASRATRQACWSWLAFGALLMAPLVGEAFQPFRNALPLVPLFCIAAGVATERLAARSGRARAVVSAAIVAGATGVMLHRELPYLLSYRERVDSRVQAVDWLAANARASDRVLVLREIAILPLELARIPGRVTVASFEETPSHVDDATMLVTGALDPRDPGDDIVRAGLASWRRTTDDLKRLASFGQRPTPVQPNMWRDTDQLVEIRRGPQPRR